MQADYDVIVVGGGGSGLAAAASCSERGLRVLLLEKQPRLGGTTGIAIGSFTANRTKFQKRASVDDTLDDHAEDAGKFPPGDIEARNNDPLRRYFLSHTADTLDWLVGLGLNFHGPSPEPPNRVPRMHNVVPNAKAYIAALQSHTLRHGGEIICDAVVREVLKEGDRVVGVDVMVAGESHRFTASRGVVLAAGDYANSPEIIARFKGDKFGDIEGINPNASGDGHLIAEHAGAKLVNMDVTYGPELRFVPPPTNAGGFMQLLPSSGPLAKLMGFLLPIVPGFIVRQMIKRLLVTWQHPENALFDDGAILINSRGERFCDESVWPDREIAVAGQDGKIAYILLDKRLVRRYNAWPHFISTAPKIAYAYVDDYIRLRPDLTTESPSLDGLAGQSNIPADTLSATVESYNEDAAANGKPKLEAGRWVLLGPVKGYFTTTEGGAAINESFEVLDVDGNVIDGLYAIGQNGLGGQVLWGHGLHIGWAMTSGRLIGIELSG